MKKTLIFGHKNPDTDTICSAISLARLKKELGMEVEAVRLGEINEETQFVLEYFRVEKPRLIRSASIEVDQVILVDHNEFQHSVDDIEKVKILEVVDHHRISNFQTADALYFRCEPIGSTATIITKMYREKGVNIPKDIAGLLLSAIISDTLLFKSPTCTDEDVLIAKQLAKIVEVDLEEYGLKLLKAGTNLSGKTVEQLITLDAKEFQMDSHKILIAQVNTVDVDEVYERQIELEEVMRKTIREQELSLFLFSATNILKGYSTALALGNLSGLVEEAFKVKLDNNKAKLKGVVSRKKQLVPMITNAYEKNK